MIYPASMNIAGQTIDVKILDNPLYQMHICPNCKNPYTSEPYRFPVPTGESKACPACGCEHTQPVDNTYVFGQYVVKDNVLKTWHSDKIPDVCGTCFVHETIEAIDSIGDLKLNHTQITSLASMLYQAFTSGGVDFSKKSESVTYANAA